MTSFQAFHCKCYIKLLKHTNKQKKSIAYPIIFTSHKNNTIKKVNIREESIIGHVTEWYDVTHLLKNWSSEERGCISLGICMHGAWASVTSYTPYKYTACNT